MREWGILIENIMPFKVKTINFEIPVEKQDFVLKEAGYKRHHKGNGWVRDSSSSVSRKRFHAKRLNNSLISIHIDKTIFDKRKSKSLHVVIPDHSMLGKEYRRINKILKKMNKSPQPTHKLKRNVFAPNLSEIQKTHHQNFKPTFFRRLLNFLS